MTSIHNRELKASKLKATVQKLRTVNTIPLIKDKVTKVVSREYSSLKDLEAVIRHDPSLSQRIVSLSNSSLYGQSLKRTDISQALMALGFNSVKDIARDVPSFQKEAATPEVMSLWVHSFEVAETCSDIASRAGGVSVEDAFLAGLLHDIGRIVLYQLFREFYWASTANIRNPMELLAKEEEVFGEEHARVGGWLLQDGLLPERIGIAVEYHHFPLRAARSKELAAAVYLAEYLVAANSDPSKGVEEGSDADLKRVFEILKMKEADMVQFMVGVLTRREKIAGFYEG